jgi:hypothetical protein
VRRAGCWYWLSLNPAARTGRDVFLGKQPTLLGHHGVHDWGCPWTHGLDRRFRIRRENQCTCSARGLACGRVHRHLGGLNLCPAPGTVIHQQHECDRQARHDQGDHARMTQRYRHPRKIHDAMIIHAETRVLYCVSIVAGTPSSLNNRESKESGNEKAQDRLTHAARPPNSMPPGPVFPGSGQRRDRRLARTKASVDLASRGAFPFLIHPTYRLPLLGS